MLEAKENHAETVFCQNLPMCTAGSKRKTLRKKEITREASKGRRKGQEPIVFPARSETCKIIAVSLVLPCGFLSKPRVVSSASWNGEVVPPPRPQIKSLAENN